MGLGPYKCWVGWSSDLHRQGGRELDWAMGVIGWEWVNFKFFPI